jgi:hypothetical protein
MNYAYSEIAVEKKKKDVRFDPRYNVISFIKVVSLAELKLKIKLNFYNRGRIMAIFKKNCAKRYVFNGNCMYLPMSESKRARAIMRAGNRRNAEKNEEIDVNLYERVKKEFVVSAKYSYANRHLFDPFYDPLLVSDVLDKVLNRNGIKLNQRQKQRWVKRIVRDKYLSLFFVFSKKCIPNGTGNYKSSRYILIFKSNQRRLRNDVFILQKRFAKAQREREEREVKSSSQTKRHISLRSKDFLYSLYSSSPGPKVGTTAKTLVRPPGDPPDGGENPFEFGVSGGGFWPPHGPDLPQSDDCDRDISCAVSAHSRLLDFDISALAGTGWRFREKRKP